MIYALLPLANHQRDAVRLLCLRATRSWGAGDLDQAFDDCLAALRIGRLASQSPTLIDSLVAVATQRIACITLEQIAATDAVSADQLREVIKQITALPTMEPMWKKIEFGERFSYLSAASLAARDGVARLSGDADMGPSSSTPPPWMLTSSLIDWNVVMSSGNKWYDTIVAAGKISNYAEHKQAVGQLSQQLNDLVGQYRRPTRMLASAATMNGRSQLMSDVMASLMLPAVSAAYQAEYRDTMFMRATVTSLWLNVYRKEHGSYPDSLDQLVPTYLPEVPVDLFDGQPLRYRRLNHGFIVYSIGPDENDDQGAPLDAGPSGLVGDLTVRVDRVDEPAE